MTKSSRALLKRRLEGALEQWLGSGSDLAKGELIGLLLAAGLSGHSTHRAQVGTLRNLIGEMREGWKSKLVQDLIHILPDIARDLEMRAAAVDAQQLKREARRFVQSEE